MLQLKLRNLSYYRELSRIVDKFFFISVSICEQIKNISITFEASNVRIHCLDNNVGLNTSSILPLTI